MKRLIGLYLLFLLASTGLASIALAEAPPIFVLKWGSLGSGDGQFNAPFEVAVDASGNIYVADYFNDRIQKFTSDGQFLGKWGSPGSGDGQFNHPYGLALDAAGNLYVSDTQNQRIQKFASDGRFLLKWGSPGTGVGEFNNPVGVGVDKTGNVYVAQQYNYCVQKFTSEGVYVAQWGSFGSGAGQFNDPYDVAADASGYVYVADLHNNRVQKFTSDGVYVTQWGSFGSGDGQFGVDSPRSLIVDAIGNVSVTDNDNNRIQKFTNSGTYITQWGSFGSGDGQFNQPMGVAANAAGSLYVSDLFNNRIQKFGACTQVGVLHLRTGQVGGVPGSCGQEVDGFTLLTDATCGAQLRTQAFSNNEFTLAKNGTHARMVNAYFGQLGSLACDPDARWISQYPLGGPNGNGCSSNFGGDPQSILYATEFLVNTPGNPYGSVNVCWAVDDVLGDYEAGAPNPAGVYLNGVPLGISGGGPVQETSVSKTVQLLTGSNWIYFYQRDAGCGVSHLILSCTVTIPCGVVTAVEGPRSDQPTDHLRLSAVPNPSSGQTQIAFTLPKEGPVTIAIYDVIGRRLRQWVWSTLPAGQHHVEWNGLASDGHRVPSGVLFYRLEAGGQTLNKKIIRLQ